MSTNYTAGSLLYKKFTTRDANVPATLSGSPVVKAYKDASTSTEENTGVTLTVDFDGVTGFNHITIDTSADATFYANGHHYAVVITTGTVGGTSVVGETVWEFDLVAASASAPTAATVAAAVWNEVNTGATHNVTNSTGKQLRSITVNTGVIYTATAPSQAGMTSVQIKLDSGASAVDNVYQWDVISIIGGTDAGDSAIINAYNGTTKVATVELPWAVQPDATSVFEITPTPKVQTVGTVSGNIISVNGTVFAGANVPAILADGVAHGGTPGSSTATLAMQAVNVTNPSGTAFVVHSTGANGKGFDILGNGTGPGIQTAGDSGIWALGNNVDQSGVRLTGGGGNGPGVSLYGAAFRIDASDFSPGISIQGGYGGGSPIEIDSLSGIDPAISITTVGGAIVQAVVSTAGGGGGGAGVGGHGIQITAAGAGKKAMLLAGDTATDGFAIAAGSGSPIGVFNADGSVNVGGIEASALAEFFTTNSTKVFSDAVSGSVVKEIASNATVSGGGGIDVNVVSWLGHAVPTANVNGVPIVDVGYVLGQLAKLSEGTAQAGASSTITLASGASATDHVYVGRQIEIVDGTGVGQARYITGYVGSTKVATVHRAWEIMPDNTSQYEFEGTAESDVYHMEAAALAEFFTVDTTKVFADAISGSVVKEIAGSGGSAPSAATVAAAVWDEALTSVTHNITNSAGKLLRSIALNSAAIYSGTLPSQVGMTSTQIKLDTGASSSDNAYNDDVVSILTNTGAGESAIITGYVGSTRVATLDRAWVVQPTATATFEITPLTTVTVSGPVTVGAMNAGVITASSIASGALNGKGDWLTSLGATAPAGWINASAIASGALNGKGDWSTLTAAGVWVNSVRTLTAGTNIVLTKGIGVTGFTDLDAAGIRAAVGMDIADLDAQLDLLPTAAEAADKILGRNIAGGSDGGRTVAEAMAFLRNKWSISGGTLIVCATNDSTTLWTATVTTTSGNPVTAIDPA